MSTVMIVKKYRPGVGLSMVKCIVFLCLLSLSPGLFAKNPRVNIIKNPKPNCETKNYVELEKAGEVIDNIDSKEFLVMPWSLVADKNGDVFCFDAMMGKIYKYNKKLELLTTFGGKGYGPGEFGCKGRGGGFIYLYLGKDNILYAGDRNNKKILCFDKSGKLLDEIKMFVKPFAYIKPAVDSLGNFYLHSENGGVVDVYNHEGRLISTLLDKKDLACGLFYELKKKLNRETFYFGSCREVLEYDIIPGDKLIVLFRSSGLLTIQDKNRVILRKFLWPKKVLESYKADLKNAIGEPGQMEGYSAFIYCLTLDRDTGKSFYLQGGSPKGDFNNYIYQFDLKGNLKKVLFIKEKIKKRKSFLQYKLNGLFYFIGYNKEENSTIYVYKEGFQK